MQQNSDFDAAEVKGLLLNCNELYVMLLLIFDQCSDLNVLNAYKHRLLFLIIKI